jgi:hypothetical protein
MKNHLTDFVKKRFKVSLDELPEAGIELFSISANAGISVAISIWVTKLTVGQRLADGLRLFGSWTFIIIFAAILFSWVLVNTVILAGAALHLIRHRTSKPLSFHARGPSKRRNFDVVESSGVKAARSGSRL